MGVGISNFKRKSEIDQVIFKLPYFNPLFQETEILLDWQFSNTILVTAFDLFRNDGLVTKLQKTGSSLKDYLHDFGFNKKIKILADTGVFELEMRKARLSKFDKYITKLDTLKTEEIFHAYNLIDPDFLVAPDEMILVNDTTQDQELKKQIILDNLQKTLSEFPRTKVIATIQGLDQKVISEITDDIREEKITKVARGGLLPLRKHSRTQFSSILTLTEKIARKANMKHLHAFGLSNINVLRDYFVHNSYNSVDTSAVYYYTVDRKYLTKKNKFVQVRKANFDLCDCAGCEIMKDNLFFADRNTKFIIGLYSHNAHQTAKMAFALQNKPSLKVEAPKINFTKSKKWKKKARLEWPGQGLVNDEFISVLELSKLRKNNLMI
ncbi:MAG: hypothetical protein GPJ54_20090 [Candidatus Heimdallarchaeota archaeon]|nr:hypothetical protein [Candidatus Heimdallarchaeota archaeon]